MINIIAILHYLVPAKESSNIIERIEASRKERHEAAVEEMQQELSVISSVRFTFFFWLRVDTFFVLNVHEIKVHIHVKIV